MRVAPLLLERENRAGLRGFAALARDYVESLRGRHPRPPTVKALVEEALREEVTTYLAHRGRQAAGFAMVAPRRGGSGERLLWVSHCYCPGDLGALRALVRDLERQARTIGCGWIGFEAAVPDMRKRAASVGFKPASVIYTKEVRNG